MAKNLILGPVFARLAQILPFKLFCVGFTSTNS